MKKLTLLLLGGAIVTGAHAQKTNPSSSVFAPKGKFSISALGVEAPAVRNAANEVARKGTGVAIASENFSSGSMTTLPTGWTAAGTLGTTATWHWTNKAATGQFNIGVINSTTASNGWMIYDSDSIGSLPTATAPFEGTLTSPAYSCTGHATVQLSFQQWFRGFQDSCFVDVTNNGTTWTTFEVQPNNTNGSNVSLASNPTVTYINISSVAANQANVRIRFRYKCQAAGGSFNWLIDDMSLNELDPVDVKLNLGGLVAEGPSPDYSTFSTFSTVPLLFVSPLTPVAALNNMGSAAQTNVMANAKIFQNGTQVYNQNSVGISLPTTAVDSLPEWTTPFTPTAVGDYTVAFSVSQAGDAITTNNIDTFRFSVSDTVYATHAGTFAGTSWYIHRPSSNPNGEGTNHFGARFDIPTGKSDTLTSLTTCFATGTTAGVEVVGHVYRLNDADTANMTWDYIASTQSITLAAADISTSTSNRFKVFPMNLSSGIAPLILTGGTYVAAFTTVSAPSTSTVLIRSTQAQYNASGLVGFYGHFSAAGNDGLPDFASGLGVATGLSNNVPLVRMNFGHLAPTGVGTIPGVTLGSVFPNPANNTVSLPITVKEKANVNVMLSNIAGQTLSAQNMGQLAANQSATATFSTSGLANGVYLLTIEANGHRTTSRFVVNH